MTSWLFILNDDVGGYDLRRMRRCPAESSIEIVEGPGSGE
ncbi:MAG: hypothetical protein QOE82_1165, partial [Thermoanaerobaculia bacterium]|nr:hypothetical protein [Thermoanaerobaculia bacterium]